MSEAANILIEELKSHSTGWIILCETPLESVLTIELDAIKLLTDEDYNVLVLSASRPYSNLLDLYKKRDIDANKLFVVDCISKTQGARIEEASNVRYMESPRDLTRIAIQMADIFRTRKGKNVLFVDSITTLLIHNKPEAFVKFIHDILTKMRMNNISALLIAIKTDANTDARTEIAQLCDAIIGI
jgi:hypothetical protein